MGSYTDRLESAVQSEKRKVRFYLVLFAFAAGMIVGSMIGTIVAQFCEQLQLAATPYDIGIAAGVTTGLIAALLSFRELQRVNHATENQTASQLSESLAVREIMLGMTGEWKVDLEDPQHEPTLQKNRFVELKDGQDMLAWLLSHIHRVERELPREVPSTNMFSYIAAVLFLLSLLGFAAERYGFRLEPGMAFSYLIFAIIIFSNPARVLRPPMLRYLLPEEVLRRLRA